jgi:hypothetical protein
MTVYVNSFFGKVAESSKTLSCATPPIEYKGHQLFNRIPGKPGAQVIDVVKDGICIAMYAGMNGARGFIDQQVAA